MKVNTTNIDYNIRKAKLKEAERKRQELQSKLENITESINNLKETEQISIAKKVNLMDKEARKDFYENEKKKTEEIAGKIKKFTEQQKQFQVALDKQIDKINKQAQKKKEEDEYQAKYLVFLRDERIKEEREKMKQKKIQRDQEIENLKKAKSETNLYLKQIPLFLKVKQKFETDIEMPELERRKEELKRKRELFSPITQEKFKEHLVWYSSLKENYSYNQKKMILDKKIEDRVKETTAIGTTWNTRAIEEEKMIKEEINRKNQIKVQMIEKRNQYADLVQEMYKPALDANYKSPRKNSPGKYNELKEKVKVKKETKSDGENIDNWKPKKIKPNTMIPPPKFVKESKPVNYLEEKRRMRENQKQSKSPIDKIARLLESSSVSGNLTNKDIDDAMKKAMKLEQMARKKALLIENTPDSIISMKEAESVDSLLLGSIRTKLAILGKLD